MHGHEMWMGGPWGGGFGFFPFWPILMIFFWIAVARLFGGRHRGWHGQGRHYAPAPPQDPALATLRERFARGEIDRAEYEERRAILLERQPQATRPAGAPASGASAPAQTDGTPGTATKRGEHGQDWPDLV